MVLKKSESPGAYLCKCPSCEKQMVYDSSNPYRPFCSKVCKTEDLASWAQEEYRVKGASLSPDDGLYSQGEPEED
ncbi:MAG: DNA gyrase inhibitor YacG [Oligoflexales bacterium]|nr:DNA gyrase inhibitor YacG [Oligoflexales bacterium]